MDRETIELSTSVIIEAEAKRLAPQMMTRLSEPVDAAIDRIAKRQGLDRDEVMVEMWDALLGEIYSALSLVP